MSELERGTDRPPLRFSSRAPFPCTTPSTETCVVVVTTWCAIGSGAR